MSSRGNNFNYFPENKLIKLANVMQFKRNWRYRSLSKKVISLLVESVVSWSRI